MAIVNWGRLFPEAARKAAARQTYAIENRGSVMTNGGPHEYVLKYYPRSDVEKLDALPFAELATGHSENDNALKARTTLLMILLAVLPLGVVALHGSLRMSVSDMTYDGALIGLGLLLLIGTVVESAALKINFTKMDVDWENAIREFFDNDTRNKMFGIRHCMLEFRRFIKWRRYMGYVLFGVASLIAIQLALLAGSVFFWWNGWTSGAWSIAEAAFSLFAIALLIGYLGRYSFLRWYYTDWRDPTLQLCVMLAEENRNTIAALRRVTVQ
ncbi:MAG TPA: hypothetical protein VMH86_02030 [Rhizomicrobium sp.]|nr:hypothetical protein [Rhizomicrobium sp.]